MGNFLIKSKSTCALPDHKFKIARQLRSTFDLAAQDTAEVRFFKVVLNRSSGYFEQYGDIGRMIEDWSFDYITYVDSQVNILQACFMFFRMDTIVNEKHDWLLIVLDPELQYHYTNNSIQALIKIQFGLPVGLTYVALNGKNLLINNFLQWYNPKIV